MINRYLIYERYEYWSKEGKTWTDWFLTFNSPYTKTEKEATTFLEEMKKFAANLYKHTKLKHEFKIQLVDVETLPHPKIKYSKRINSIQSITNIFYFTFSQLIKKIISIIIIINYPIRINI